MPLERELSQRKISGMKAIVQDEHGEPLPPAALRTYEAAGWGFAAAHERFRMLDGDAVMAVRDGLKAWADRASAEHEPLLRWASEHPDGAALRERWARDLASSASSILAPGWAWLLDADDGEIQQPISDAELDDFAAPLPAGLILRALSDATRLEVLKVIDHEAPRAEGWGQRWLRWWRWLGVEVEGDPKHNDAVWARWVDARYLRALLQDAWLGRWRGEAVEARRGPRYLPALIDPVYRDLGQALELRRVEVNPAQMTLPGLVPVLTAGVEAVRGALVAAETLSPTVAHRLVRWIMAVAAMASSVGRGFEVRLDERAVARQTAAGVEIEIEGGIDALRQLLGITKKGSEIEAVIDIFAAHSIPWAVAHNYGNAPLLTLPRGKRKRPGVTAYLVLSVSPLLCPGMASDTTLRASDRVLVPCLPPPPLPPGGRAHGGLLALDWLAVLRLAELRADLRAEGGVRLDWPRLAKTAGVSRETLARALDLWTNPATGRWVELPGGLWRLADRGDEGRAHELLVEGAAMSAAGSEAGKQSASARRKARSRYE